MHTKAFREKLVAALPEGHPLVEQFDAIEASHSKDIIDVFDVIDDWKRGIRDWSEVDRLIQLVKDPL